MTLELIVFIASVLFGILIYWRESQSNRLYRFFNRVFNSKKLQMAPTNRKGFIYEQNFLMRIVYVSFLFLLLIVITRFIIPIDLATISIFASAIVGTVIGTYVAGFLITSERVIGEKGEHFEKSFHETVERGREYIDDLRTKDAKVVEEAKNEIEKEDSQEISNKKSARERLKDKGYLK